MCCRCSMQRATRFPDGSRFGSQMTKASWKLKTSAFLYIGIYTWEPGTSTPPSRKTLQTGNDKGCLSPCPGGSGSRFPLSQKRALKSAAYSVTNREPRWFPDGSQRFPVAAASIPGPGNAAGARLRATRAAGLRVPAPGCVQRGNERGASPQQRGRTPPVARGIYAPLRSPSAALKASTSVSMTQPRFFFATIEFGLVIP